MRSAVFGGCFALGGAAGMFGAFWLYFLATDDPASWLARHTRPH